MLLVFTVLALAAFDWRSKRLERARNSQAETLRATSERLDALTSTIETELRSTLLEIQNQADCLVRVDGGFLPRSGQERLEWIHGASSHLNGVLDELLASPTAADRASEPRKVEPQAADSELARSRTA